MPVFDPALPDGMLYATVTLGPARVFEQAGAGMSIRADMLGTVPTDPLTRKAPRLSWGPDLSGWYNVSSGGDVTAGEEISFIVPCTNQTGWKWNGNAVTDGHALTVTISLTATIAGRKVTQPFGPFVITVEQAGTTVDLDDLIDMTTDMGQTIKVTDQWSAMIEAAAASAAAAEAAWSTLTLHRLADRRHRLSNQRRAYGRDW